MKSRVNKPGEVSIKRARALLAALRRRYPDAHCALDWRAPHELLIATMLSAQATDVGVNKATPALFAAFDSPHAFARASPAEIEPYLKTINFWRNKARAVHEAMRAICLSHGGEVPREMQHLVALRGVARKTANVVLGNAFGVNDGVVVDTHVMRLSQRLGLTQQTAPERIERDLMALFPQSSWCELSHLLIAHGRAVCKARGGCCAQDHICRKFGACGKSAAIAPAKVLASKPTAARSTSSRPLRAPTRKVPSPPKR